MTGVLAAIVLATAAGVALERRFGPRAEELAARTMRVLLYVLFPFITFFVIARLELDAGVGVGLVLAYLELAIVGALGWWVATRVLHAPRPAAGAVVVCVVAGNTGYFGIPVNATLLGTDAIAPAIAWDTGVSGPMLYGVGFAVAAACGTRSGETPRERFRAFFTRNPPLYALAAALLAPDVLAPDVLATAAEILSLTLLPIAFCVLGITLGREAEEGTLGVPPPVTRLLSLTVGLRVLVAPLLFALLATSAAAAGAGPPGAYYVQAAAPCAINSLVAAHVFGLDTRLAAGAVAWSTAAAALGAVGAALVGVG